MAQSIELLHRTFVAENDLSDNRYYAMKLGTGDNEIDTAGDNDVVIGVLQGEPEAGHNAEVRTGGTTKVVAGNGSVSKGDRVKADGDGKAVTADSDEDNAFGIALEASGAANDHIEVLLTPGVSVSVTAQ